MVVDAAAEEERQTDLLFKALGDSTRRDILGRAREGELSVSALARLYPVSLAAVQKHVATLERAGLVSRQRRGRETVVHAETEALRRAHAALDRLESAWRGRIERIDQILDHPENGDPKCQ
ncbi:MAG TPA: metalloregulator ArsR/SmtB family transcription factor [Solirubrobacterales bacterium]|nr:metalloregulator ArsR/SmtB family transcription factor [Solirubrobacterales bacterium]